MAAGFAQLPTPDPDAAAAVALAAAQAAQADIDALVAAISGLDTAAEIKAALDAIADTNLLTDAERASIAAAIETGDLAAGVLTFLGTPSGANLAAALTTALPVTKGGTGGIDAASARAGIGADDHPLGCYFTFTGAASAYTTELQVIAFRAPYAMTVSAAHLISAKTSTGSSGIVYWESYLRNATAGVNLCSAKKNTGNNGELTINVPWDLAPNQNLSIAAGDVLVCTVRSLGGPTTMINIPWSWCIVAKRT